MRNRQIRRALTLTKQTYGRLLEIEKEINRDNADNLMKHACKQALDHVQILGMHLCNCIPNGSLLNQEFYIPRNAQTHVQQPRSFSSVQTVDAGLPPVPDVLTSTDDMISGLAWCDECENPKGACTCPGAFRR